MKKNIGLVLSGGGARTIAHIGLIKALEEENINITHVSGTSAGAIVAALYASDYSAQEILDFFKKTVLFKVSFYAASQISFLSTNEYSGIFKQYFKYDDFEALNKKLYVSATDIVNAKNKIFQSGKLVKTLLASAAYPMVFKPVKIDGKLYLDGGITNDFPIEPLRWQCDLVIGSYVTPLSSMGKIDLENRHRLLQRTYDVSSLTNSIHKFPMCDMMFQPNQLSQFGFYEGKYLDDIYRIGYLSAKGNMGELKRKIEQLEMDRTAVLR